MEKFKLTTKMIEGERSKILFKGETTDKEINFYGWGQRDKPLKFVVAKGYIDDWCIYVESMDQDMPSFEYVKDHGNKVIPAIAFKLIDCREVMDRYRL